MITIKNPDVAVKLTTEQAISLGIDINAESHRGDLITQGMWDIPVRFISLCISVKFSKGLCPVKEEITIYGKRTMTNPRQNGYCLDGQVSIKGRKYSSYTSSQMFEVDGRLIDVCTINARVR